MKIPTIDKAKEYLEWAAGENAGAWVAHSMGVAETAHVIARNSGMDGEAAYAMGLLHDIGRYEGVTALRHVMAGYELMMREGYPDAARICMSHSFASKQMSDYVGKQDCAAEAVDFIEKYIKEADWDDYDRLIQVCDCLVKTDGVCLMEKRLVDVTMRYGSDNDTVRRWIANLGLLQYFNEKCKKPVYTLFDREELMRRTFFE